MAKVNLKTVVKINGKEKKSLKSVCNEYGLDYYKTYHEFRTSMSKFWKKEIKEGVILSVRVN